MSIKLEKYDKKTHLKITPPPINADPDMIGLPKYLQPHNFYYIICGVPGSGKSSLIFNLFCKPSLLNYYQRFDRVFLFTKSTDAIDFPIDKNDIIKGLDYDVLYQIINDKTLKGSDILMIFDDVVHDMKRNNSEFKKICDNRRHLFLNEREKIQDIDENDKIFRELVTGNNYDNEDIYNVPKGIGSCSICITSQKYNAVPLNFRNACSGLFIFDPKIPELQVLYDEVISEYFDKKIFNKKIKKEIFSDPYDFLLIDLKKKKLYKNFLAINIIRE